MDSTQLGQLALSYELIDEAQLERCLELQETSSPPRYLGEVLVSEGILNERTLSRLLSAQRKEITRQHAGERFERTRIAERLQPGAGIQPFLEVLAELGGQELHLAAGSRPTARINGSLLSLRPEPMEPGEVDELVTALAPEQSFVDGFASQQSASFVHAAGELGRFRTNLFRQRAGAAIVLCRINAQLPAIEELGLPDVVREVPKLKSGLVLVTGPRASGKTTTLAALVELINAQRRCHVVCLEETVEFVHKSRFSLVTQVQVGRDVADWDLALHATLRLDPDVIVAGDLDSPGRLATALRAAETGHLVLGTMPTARAEQTLTALIRGCGIERRNQVCASLADLLRFVFCQQLVPDQEASRFVLASEVMRNTPAIANMIREQRFHQLNNVLQTSRDQGMLTLDESLYTLVRRDQISAGDALARAGDPDRLFLRLQANGGKTA